MTPLIRSGLMFGNLIHIDSPALIDRYNRALEHLTGKRTALSDFHIDISGFSPEVGDELGDPLYLNHLGCNRQFILLTTRQQGAPLLDATFSTSRGILKQFIAANEDQLFALTARDAVAGELVNSVFSVADPARLLDIRKIRVEADTTKGTLRDAAELGRLSDRFLQEEDAWFDDLLIAQMISVAERTGDIARNPVTLGHAEFDQPDFWTSHFGGLYVFRAAGTVIGADVPAEMPARAIALSDRKALARFLDEQGLVEPIIRQKGAGAAAVLRQKMDFILVDMADGAGIPLEGTTRGDLRRIARAHADKLPPEYTDLSRMVAWAEEGAPWPRVTSADPAYFYTLRAAPGPAKALVNQLLSELCPKDFRQLFICHKPAFYRAFRGWSETRQAYAVEYLSREYMADKAGARAQLFGADDPLVREPEATEGPWDRARAAEQAAQRRDEDRKAEERLRRVGPWSSLGRVR